MKYPINTENEARINKYYYGEEVALINYKLNQFVNKKKVDKEILKILNNWIVPKLPINGDDVITYKKMKGKDIGIILHDIEKWWIRNDFHPDRKECLQKLKSI